MGRSADRLSLALLFTPFALWIGLLIVLPQLGIGYVSLREKVAELEAQLAEKRPPVPDIGNVHTIAQMLRIWVGVHARCMSVSVCSFDKNSRANTSS